MHAIEAELIKATKFKPAKKYKNRQEYLMSIFNAANKLEDEDFDELSEEAAAWLNDCVQIFNAKNGDEFPDFDEVSPGEDDEDETEDVTSEGTDESAEDDPEDEDDGDADQDESDDELPSGDDEVQEDGDGSEDDAEEPEEPVKKSKKAAPKKEAKKEEKSKRAPPKPKGPKGIKQEGDVELDKWGCMVGSKNSQALSMFEQGATAKEVKDAIGGTYYNILRRMVERGHTMEKDGAMITITHSDDNKPKTTSKKSKK